MNPEELKARTQSFGLRIIRLVSALPRDPAARVIGRQVLRSGTSVGANYRAACRAKSRADFAAKIAIVEEEVDETLYWLEVLIKSRLVKAERLQHLIKETEELVAIVSASRKAVRRHLSGPREQQPARVNRQSTIDN
jgi:four helix bundle protein